MNASAFLAPLQHKAFWIDAAIMLLFAIMASMAHEGVGIFHTFWPFGLGVYIGWFVFRIAEQNAWTLDAGVRIWMLTLATGLVIWFLRNLRMPHWSFLVVATFTSIVLIVGWRVIAGFIRKDKQPSGRVE